MSVILFFAWLVVSVVSVAAQPRDDGYFAYRLVELPTLSLPDILGTVPPTILAGPGGPDRIVLHPTLSLGSSIAEFMPIASAAPLIDELEYHFAIEISVINEQIRIQNITVENGFAAPMRQFPDEFRVEVRASSGESEPLFLLHTFDPRRIRVHMNTLPIPIGLAVPRLRVPLNDLEGGFDFEIPEKDRSQVRLPEFNTGLVDVLSAIEPRVGPHSGTEFIRELEASRWEPIGIAAASGLVVSGREVSSGRTGSDLQPGEALDERIFVLDSVSRTYFLPFSSEATENQSGLDCSSGRVRSQY